MNERINESIHPSIHRLIDLRCLISGVSLR